MCQTKESYKIKVVGLIIIVACLVLLSACATQCEQETVLPVSDLTGFA